MRLEKLTLAPYGGFEDRTLVFDSAAPLHVVFGRNEAGKTTTLNAISDWLFGFPLRTDQGWRFDMTALRVGGALRFADGSLLEARRRKGRGNTLVDAADKPISDAALVAALGGISRETFELEFGLTARALREGGEAVLKAGGALAETLAAGSSGLSALVKLRERLAGEAGDLFTPRRSAGKAFYVALDSYEAADRKLREAVVTAEALKSAESRKVDAFNDENRLREDYEESGRALARLERAGRTQATLARLAALQRDAEGFADLPEIDASALAAARKALDDDRALQSELARLAADAEAEALEIETLAVDQAMLGAAEAIDSAREKLGAVRKAADDLPRRTEARAQALAQLDDLARRLGLPDHEALLAAPPSDPDLALARRALEARREAAGRLEDARAAVVKETGRRDALGPAEPPPADPEPLRRRLDAIAARQADAETLRRERLDLSNEARALAEEAGRLDPAVPDLEALARAPVPGAAEIAPYVEADQSRAKARQVVERELDKSRRELAAAEAALAALEREAKGATRTDWLAARARRERALDRLGEALDGEVARRREAFEVVRDLVAAADHIGDAVVDDTERAARLQSEREGVAARRTALAQAEGEARRLGDEAEAAHAVWTSLWARAGLAPRPPAAMARWADRLEALLQRRTKLAARSAQAAELGRRVEEAEAALRQWFEALGVVAPTGFEIALSEARDEVAARQRAWDGARKAADARAAAARAVAEAEAGVTRRERELADILAGWPQAMRGLRLAESATPAEAEAALAAWAGVPLPRQTVTRETRSIEGIERDLSDFARAVGEIVAAVAPDLADLPPEAALGRLVTALDGQRRAAARKAQLEKSAETRQARRRREEAQRHALAPSLAALRDYFGATGETELALALERCEARRACEAERVKAWRQLADSGDGLDEEELRAEQVELDLAALAEALTSARARRAELITAMAAAARAARDAEADYEALARGRDAASAARERMEARGELLDIAERWALRQGAAKLAERVVERHRAAAQDPLIARAGEFFATATGASFSGLATDYDDADRPTLVAARANGRKVKVEALSEGARDQLFLSLRLALLERRAGEPLPFIGDDILASFDDARTALTLRLLADFGRARQVLLFTHHNHVAELARAAGADVVEI